jgi:hypothetical protein
MVLEQKISYHFIFTTSIVSIKKYFICENPAGCEVSHGYHSNSAGADHSTHLHPRFNGAVVTQPHGV